MQAESQLEGGPLVVRIPMRLEQHQGRKRMLVPTAAS